MKEAIVQVKDYLSKSNLPTSDYVINPYVGCPHGCRYCYASFMKRFTKHSEDWGTFIDIKHCEKAINTKLLMGKRLFLSSVTDCYNKYEKEHKITRHILEQIVNIDCELTISTKASLILRDLDLLKRCKNLKVCMSINTLDETFKKDMDFASSIQERLDTLKKLHEAGIHTVLFMSPIFPFLTDFKAIIDVSKDFIDEYWFENLNLRGSYKVDILSYIHTNYPQYEQAYNLIYQKRDLTYWQELAQSIDEYCTSRKVNYTNYFYHSTLVKEKIAQQKKQKV